jgi:tetratricopeptide (TPR) repeat protein
VSNTPSRALIRVTGIALIAFGWTSARGLAQAPAHKHYESSPEAEKPSATGELAPRLQNLGPYAFPVTTRSTKAQAFVNQGVNLAYGFNHVEAGRAFREAARLDPSCAMAYWGQALVLGPNINLPMTPDDEPKAYALAQKAVALKAKASPRERAYIDAVAKRYSGKAEDRSARDQAYADAMRDLAKRYPADLDAATLFAESLMDLRPWAYWAPDGKAYPGTNEAVAALESVLARKPAHPGANHYYIHVVEATKSPDRAEAAADRLRTLMPGAGHMVHMPGHIYMRVGRYADASAVNEAAIVADEDYIAQCRAQGMYPIGYYPHNIHFLWSAASMEGRSEKAIAAARKVATRATDESMDALPLLAGFRVVPYYALTRFGHWDEMLKEPAPPDRFVYLTGTWHYARGIAFAGKGQLEEAEKELDEVKKIAGGTALDFTLFSPNKAAAIFAIAPEALAGVIALKKKEFDLAIAHLERAVRLEDGLVYTEPAEWHYPPRELLGAALLEAGRPHEAETVYWDDLRRNAENGWSLFGLSKALAAQGRKDEAAAIDSRFRKAWAKGDVTLQASAF